MCLSGTHRTRNVIFCILRTSSGYINVWLHTPATAPAANLSLLVKFSSPWYAFNRRFT
jgi:hypothetical protein